MRKIFVIGLEQNPCQNNKKEDPDQTASSEDLLCLSRTFDRELLFKNFRTFLCQRLSRVPANL